MTRRRRNYSTSDHGNFSTGLGSILFESTLARYRLERLMRNQDADDELSGTTSHQDSAILKWIRTGLGNAVDVIKAAFMVFVWQLILNVVRVVVFAASTILVFCIGGFILYLMLTTWPDW